MVKKEEQKVKPVRLVDSKITIPNIYDLEKLGAGHDGKVFRYEELALKNLKYDIVERKEKNLMSYDKATYFTERLDLKRITVPIDTMLDEDGVYTGYAMACIENLASEKKKGTEDYKEPGDFTLWDLAYATAELSEDFNQLTENKIVASDINRGSYIYSFDFLHLCDTDKYKISTAGNLSITNQNRAALNFAIAKMLYYEMQKSKHYDKNNLKILSRWVRKMSNSTNFLATLNQEFGSDLETPIREYVDYKVKQIVR